MIRRRVVKVDVLIETDVAGDDEHERMVSWCCNNIAKANRYNKNLKFISTIVRSNDGGEMISFSHGIPSKEASEWNAA